MTAIKFEFRIFKKKKKSSSFGYLIRNNSIFIRIDDDDRLEFCKDKLAS